MYWRWGKGNFIPPMVLPKFACLDIHIARFHRQFICQFFPATQKNGMTEVFNTWRKIQGQFGRQALRHGMPAWLEHEGMPKSELKSILGLL